MILILLSVITLVEILRLIIPHWPVSEKRHFKQKLEGVKKMVWDLNFKIFKTREIREDIRVLYDNNKSRLFNLEKQITEWPKKKSEEDKKRIEDEIVRLKKDIERNEDQLRALDTEVSGAQPSNQYPEGVQGISQQVDSLQELKQMLKDWIKTL